MHVRLNDFYRVSLSISNFFVFVDVATMSRYVKPLVHKCFTLSENSARSARGGA
jgi:hypothetical protein